MKGTKAKTNGAKTKCDSKDVLRQKQFTIKNQEVGLHDQDKNNYQGYFDQY